MLLGISNGLCDVGMPGACSEDENIPDPRPQNQGQANYLNFGNFLSQLILIPITRGDDPAPLVVERDTVIIKGFTKHGVNRAIGDGGARAGVRPQAILDAVRSPRNVKTGIDANGRPYTRFIGNDARVVINPQTREVISVNPLSGKGAH